MKKEYTKPTLEVVSFTSDTSVAATEDISSITAKLGYQQQYSTVTYY